MTVSHRNAGIPAGSTHPLVRRCIDIRRNRHRPRELVCAVDSTWIVRRAAEAVGVEIEAAFVCDELVRGEETTALVDDLLAGDVLVLKVSERVFGRLADRDGPDGVAAIVRLPRRTLEDVALPPDARVVVADAFDLAGNLGTVIRCADGAGAAAVVVTERRIRITHPLVARASMGTVFSLPVIEASREDAAAWLRQGGVRVVVADPAAADSYRSADYGGRVAIVLGSERHGVAPFWHEHADVSVSIPMLGVADSLNVGHAAALLLYEALLASGGSHSNKR